MLQNFFLHIAVGFRIKVDDWIRHVCLTVSCVPVWEEWGDSDAKGAGVRVMFYIPSYLFGALLQTSNTTINN